MLDLSDADCLMLLRTNPGDRQAFGALFERYDRRLQCHLRAQYPGLNEEDLREICQETWLKALKSLSDKVRVEALRAWLYRIGKNLAIDLFRRQKTRAEISFEMENRPSRHPDHIQQLAFGEQLKNCLDKLPEHKRDFVQMLLDLEEYADIAVKMNLRIERIYQLKHEVGKALRACMEQGT